MTEGLCIEQYHGIESLCLPMGYTKLLNDLPPSAC